MEKQLLTISRLFVRASQEDLLMLLSTPLQNKSEPTREKTRNIRQQIITKKDNILALPSPF
jgi:hypothetical protein